MFIFEETPGALPVALTECGLLIRQDFLEFRKGEKRAIGFVIEACSHVADDFGQNLASRENRAEQRENRRQYPSHRESSSILYSI
jgi:hypothetical protein